jgi:hypothetical protein
MSIPVSTIQTCTPSPKNPSDWISLIPVSSYAHSESGKIGIKYALTHGQLAINKIVANEKNIAPLDRKSVV